MTDEEFEKMIDEFLGGRAETVQKIPDPRFTETSYNKTPNGGDYSIAYYYDAQGNPCAKENAHAIHIVEYKNNGDRVNENYGLLG